MKKVLRNIRSVFRDCYRAFPGSFVGILLSDLTGTAVSVLSPLLLARVLELAGEQGGNGEGLAGAIVLYGLCMAYVPVNNVLFRSFSKAARVRGVKYFGSQLAAFSEKIHLEALEDPETLNKFHRAETGENSQFILLEQILLTSNNIITCVGMIIVVGRYSPILIFTGLFGLFPALLTKIYFERRQTVLRRRQSMALRRCGYLRGLFSDRESVKEMRVMGFEGYLTELWKDANAARVREFREVNLDIRKKRVWGILAINTCYVLNIGVSFYLMIQGRISIGSFAACLSAFTAYDGSMQAFLAAAFEAIRTYHIVEDYYDYFTIPTEEDGLESYRPFEEKITVKDVRFRYCGSREEALSGLSCEIKKGEHVVIVGENGSGKTTFSKLLTGVYLPTQGNIAYDGQNTRDLNRAGLYRHISVVSQDFVHYPFSLRENVGISDIRRMEDTEDMKTLLCQVAGEEFLDKTGGLDVPLGREFGGQELSGGEWQKVAIARGLWKESDIIILDEPTSALDPLVEYDILSKFLEMIQNKTSVIISHRVGICRTADKIIVMKAGRMAECGRHEELLRTGGEYARIWQEQAKWYK